MDSAASDEHKETGEAGTPMGLLGLLEIPEDAAVVVGVNGRDAATMSSMDDIVPDSPTVNRSTSPSKKKKGSKLNLLSENGQSMPVRMVTADTPKSLYDHDVDPVVFNTYNVRLHSSGNAYIPKALRAQLRTGANTSEMRKRVAIVFVGMQNLALTDPELASHTIEGSKLDALNNAFVSMTRIVHVFNGEVRDLLFDDKGCIFIAVFGAHAITEMSDLKAVKVLFLSYFPPKGFILKFRTKEITTYACTLMRFVVGCDGHCAGTASC